ncbi:hypothetical protein A2U01_0073077, partial [Trifolium medium]|nr:hypothetical protein [Trifolium medium]
MRKRGSCRARKGSPAATDALIILPEIRPTKNVSPGEK